jgi:probable HAF family extracellular repeat protein
MANMRTLVFSLFILLTCGSLAGAQGTLTTLDFPGSIATGANGINSSGEVVGWFLDSANLTHGFLLSGGTYTQLDVPGYPETIAGGINDVGQIVGGSYGGLFIYDMSTRAYTSYTWGTGDFVIGVGINNAGMVVGFATHYQSGFSVGLEFDGTNFTKYAVPGADSTELLSINNENEIIASASARFTTAAYLVEGSKRRRLEIARVPTASVSAISDTGVVTGTYVPSPGKGDAGFEIQGNTFTKFVAGVNGTIPYAVNDSGQVVGFFYDSSFKQHGFLWTPSSPAMEN